MAASAASGSGPSPAASPEVTAEVDKYKALQAGVWCLRAWPNREQRRKPPPPTPPLNSAELNKFIRTQTQLASQLNENRMVKEVRGGGNAALTFIFKD